MTERQPTPRGTPEGRPPAHTAPRPPVPGARYTALFDALRARREGAFVPFFVLGDPDLATSARLLSAAVEAGADALEVGIPFSDPVADGPVVQRATLRAAAAGATPAACFELVAAFRAAHPRTPVGLLTYANLAVGPGLDAFYERAAQAGIDSVLVADVPLVEAEPFSRAARARGVAPILIAPPNLPPDRLPRLRDLCDGYTYCVARKGVTGIAPPRAPTPATPTGTLGPAAIGTPVPTQTGVQGRASAVDVGSRATGTLGSASTGNVEPAQTGSLARDGLSRLLEALRAAGAPPPLVGFGVSEPEHVRTFLRMGAAGAISGSAIAALIEAAGSDTDAALERVSAFVRRMKEATSLE